MTSTLHMLGGTCETERSRHGARPRNAGALASRRLHQARGLEMPPAKVVGDAMTEPKIGTTTRAGF